MWNNQGGYDQGYGDQGGGYMTSPGGFGSQQGAAAKSRSRVQNMIPCTTGMIFAAVHEDDKFVTDGIELHQVTFVGLVRSVKESATRLDYEIDDMTAPPLEVRQFVDNDENSEERTIPMRENTYVRVFGNVREFSGKRNVVAFKIMPIMDANEITTSILECFHCHLALTKGGDQMSMTAGAGDPSGANFQSGNYPGGQPDAMNGLTQVQQQVQMVIRSCKEDAGYSIQHICSQLRNYSESAIRDAIDFLSSEGHIYSTIDDDHFRSTDAME